VQSGIRQVPTLSGPRHPCPPKGGRYTTYAQAVRPAARRLAESLGCGEGLWVTDAPEPLAVRAARGPQNGSQTEASREKQLW
jgi:hypothetical protein